MCVCVLFLDEPPLVKTQVRTGAIRTLRRFYFLNDSSAFKGSVAGLLGGKDGIKTEFPSRGTIMGFCATVASFQASAAARVCAFKKVSRSTFNSPSVQRVRAGKRRGKGSGRR